MVETMLHTNNLAAQAVCFIIQSIFISSPLVLTSGLFSFTVIGVQMGLPSLILSSEKKPAKWQ